MILVRNSILDLKTVPGSSIDASCSFDTTEDRHCVSLTSKPLSLYLMNDGCLRRQLSALDRSRSRDHTLRHIFSKCVAEDHNIKISTSPAEWYQSTAFLSSSCPVLGALRPDTESYMDSSRIIVLRVKAMILKIVQDDTAFRVDLAILLCSHCTHQYYYLLPKTTTRVMVSTHRGIPLQTSCHERHDICVLAQAIRHPTEQDQAHNGCEQA